MLPVFIRGGRPLHTINAISCLLSSNKHLWLSKINEWVLTLYRGAQVQ